MTCSARGLVSVVMPFLNIAQYLGEAIESVLAQSYTCWELLLVDDGSTDGSAEIAKRYAERAPERVRYLQHPGGGNHGASAARNLALAAARGEFVALLDGDDVWLPRKLEEQVALLRAHPEAGLVYGRTLYWHSWTGTPGDRERDHLPELRVRAGRSIDPPRLLRLCLSGRAVVPCPCSILVRRSLTDTVGGFEEQFRTLYDDQVLYSKLLLVTPALPVDVCWDKYRQHENSICAQAKKSGTVLAARLHYLAWLESYLRAHRVADRQLWRTLRFQGWRSRNPRADRLLIRLDRLSLRVHAFAGRTALGRKLDRTQRSMS
jgi:glycosyltransferase involved in cell wall biosynthesis